MSVKSSERATLEASSTQTSNPCDEKLIDETIVCFASNYFFDPTSKHHVMRELSKTRSVLWINWHASRRPSLNRRDLRSIIGKLRQIGRGVTKVHQRLWVMTPFVIPLPSSRIARKLNQWLVTLQTRWVLRKMPQKRQLWSFTPDITSLLGTFGEQLQVYYCVDEFSAFPGYDANTIQKLDKKMCESSDLVITSSTPLFESKQPLNPRKTIYVPHGVQYERFAKAVSSDFPEAEDVQHIPKPRIGFFGLIHDWWDLDLIANIAKKKEDWSFVFVGQQNVDVSRFATIPNMHFIGRREHEELPGYCRSFDAAIIPHKDNELTKNMNPIKLLEYLAAGLPVVSGPLFGAESYEPEVRVAEGVDDWIVALEQAIIDRDPKLDAERSAAVSREGWAARVQVILAAVEKAASENQR